MTFTIATWNINSVRLRIDLVARFVDLYGPDVLCLQETKCQDGQFPLKAVHAMGYTHTAIHGQKGYHGVAILSRYPLAQVERFGFYGKEDARHIAATLTEGPGAGIRMHNFYVPAGGDEPDVAVNDKFAHKLGFLDEMEAHQALVAAAKDKTILVGDLNIAPLEHDVWSSKQLTKVVSHTPLERTRLGDVQKAGQWVDVLRHLTPADQKLYTWWSYRAADWAAANKGRRLDHIWASPPLAGTIGSMTVAKEARGWEKPSDHAPVVAVFLT